MDYRHLKKICQASGCDFEYAKHFYEKVNPLFLNAGQKLGENFLKASIEQINLTEQRMENFLNIRALNNESNLDKCNRKQVIAFRLHTLFLTMVEGIFTPDVNFIAFLLILDGNKITVGKNGADITNLRELERISLSRKLEFLGKHGFQEIHDRRNDIVELRNAVAHLYYNIQESGTIRCRGIPISEEKLGELLYFMQQMSASMYTIHMLYAVTDGKPQKIGDNNPETNSYS